jgi:hypothetical protein
LDIIHIDGEGRLYGLLGLAGADVCNLDIDINIALCCQKREEQYQKQNWE